MDQPCVRDQCRRQWIAAPLAARDDVSAALLSDSPDSFQAIASRTADKSTMNKVDSFDYTLLGDTVNERPHGHMERISKNARRAKFPWLASRFRIKENL